MIRSLLTSVQPDCDTIDAWIDRANSDFAVSRKANPRAERPEGARGRVP